MRWLTWSDCGEIVAQIFHGRNQTQLAREEYALSASTHGSDHARNGFEQILAETGIAKKNGKPYHPQTQGKVERFHQTLKNRTARPASGRVPGAAQPVTGRDHRLLQHPATTPCTGTGHATGRLPGPPQGSAGPGR